MAKPLKMCFLKSHCKTYGQLFEYCIHAHGEFLEEENLCFNAFIRI